MLDKFTIKEILAFIILLNFIGIAGVYVCWQYLKVCLKDHATIYKKISRSGELPE